MREIVFKGKRIDNGEWVKGGYVNKTDCYGMECDEHYIIDGTVTDMEGYGEHYLVDKDTLCQYIGLTDRNGNKIWENDIVMLDDEYWVVKWSDDDAQFKIEDDCTIENFGNVWGMDCEVHGNSFDNPELLEGGAK